MKLATLTSGALATVLLAGSALAYAPADANVPTREYEVGVVTAEPTTGEAIKVDTASVYSPREQALIGQDTVNQYVFSSNENAQDKTAAQYR